MASVLSSEQFIPPVAAVSSASISIHLIKYDCCSGRRVVLTSSTSVCIDIQLLPDRSGISRLQRTRSSRHPPSTSLADANTKSIRQSDYTHDSTAVARLCTSYYAKPSQPIICSANRANMHGSSGVNKDMKTLRHLMFHTGEQAYPAGSHPSRLSVQRTRRRVKGIKTMLKITKGWTRDLWNLGRRGGRQEGRKEEKGEACGGESDSQTACGVTASPSSSSPICMASLLHHELNRAKATAAGETSPGGVHRIMPS